MINGYVEIFLYELNLGTSDIEIKNKTKYTDLCSLNLISFIPNPYNEMLKIINPIAYLGNGPKNIKNKKFNIKK